VAALADGEHPLTRHRINLTLRKAL